MTKYAWLILLWACAGVTAWGDREETTLPDGIRLSVAGQRVEMRVAAEHAFCLSVSAPAEKPLHSIYLESKAGGAFRALHENGATGIATDFGQLLVRADKAAWSLHDAKGRVLIDWTPLGKVIAGEKFQFAVGASPAEKNPRYYGSGSMPNLGSLTQEGVVPKAGNGTAGLPQYWSSAGYGVLVVGKWDNDPASWKTSRDGVEWSVPGDRADIYLMPASDLYAWTRGDAELTGFAPVPPRWALGYLQSRWGWESKAYIDETFAHFRRDKLPVDAFILDFEWYTTKPDYSVPPEGDPEFQDFGYNAALLPEPEKQMRDFNAQGLRIVGIRKPRLGNKANLEMAGGKNWIVPVNPRDPNDTLARFRNLDFSNPDVQAYWKENNRKFVDEGMSAFWNDEGEVNFTDYMYWNSAEVELFRAEHPAQRFWSLNRSFAPGLQRYGTTAWTGDIPSDWATLAKTPGELLSYGLSGMPWSTCDIGGYYGNPAPELMARWMQAGVFFPVMRAHSEHTFTPRFPWLFGPEAEAAIRQALELRYRLLPYAYSLAHETSATGAPVMRPLVMEFPGDAKCANLTDEWLMGRGLLTAPLLNEGGKRSVYLPSDTWYALGTTKALKGPQTLNITAKLEEIPVYVRAGMLLPRGPVLQSTTLESGATPLELQIYPGKDGAFDLIEDDNETTAYREGTFRKTSFRWDDKAATLKWTKEGGFTDASSYRSFKAVLFSPSGPVTREGKLGEDGTLVFR